MKAANSMPLYDDNQTLPVLQENRQKGLFQCGKCVTLRNITAVKTAFEPLITLCGCSVCEAVRNNPSLTLFLQTVIADGLRRIQSIFQITVFEDPAFSISWPQILAKQSACNSIFTDRRFASF